MNTRSTGSGRREDYRHISYIAPHAKGIIMGFGLKSYNLAISSFINK